MSLGLSTSSAKLASVMECKVVVVGDAKTGKSALIRRLTHDEFLEPYTPTGFDKVKTVQEVNKHNVEFVLWDTSGSPSYDSVRSLSYQEADVFLLCFKVSDPISLYNVKNKWSPELRKHRPDTPVVLCGCQVDLRADPATVSQLAKVGRAPVSQEQALAICCEVEAVNYVETSARTPTERDISEAFELCALAAIKSGGFRRSCSSSQRNVNVSFGSQASDLCGSAKRNSVSASSSLKKSCNVSFSGSESEFSLGKSVPPIMEDDDVFPGGSSSLFPAPLSPRFRDRRHMRGDGHRSSLGVVRMRNESHHPPHEPHHRASALLPDSASGGPQQGSSAQVRPNGLSRRTSFRSQQQQKQSIPVSSPKSPLGSASSYELRSPLASHPPPTIQIFDLKSATCATSPNSSSSSSSFPAKLVGFESLKSHTSTGSQGSTGSKTSTGSSVVSTVSSKGMLLLPPPKIIGSIMDPNLPDTEDPKLLSQLQFVSPKTGVFRPVPGSGVRGKASKKKQSCCVM